MTGATTGVTVPGMIQTRLMHWLEEHGYSMNRAAKELGITAQAVSKHAVKNGMMTYPVAMDYHRKLGVPLELLDRHHEDALKIAREAKEARRSVPPAKSSRKSGT